MLENLRYKLGKRLLQPVLKKNNIQDNRLHNIPKYREGRPIWSNWSPESAVKYGLKSNTWVYRCVKKRADSIATIPWIVEELNGEGWQPAPEHPIEILLKKPIADQNTNLSGSKLFRFLMYHLDLAGNGLWYLNMVNGVPMEIWPLMPQYTKPVPDRRNIISHYEYNINGDTKKLDPKNIIHFMYVDPDNLYWGLSPLQVGAKVVDTDVEAINWNKNSLQNRTVSDGVFSFKYPMTKEQWETQREMVSNQKQGSDNAHDLWILGADAHFQEMSRTPVEMDFIAGRKFSMYEICALFGIDPLIIGAPDSSSRANKHEATKSFWEDSVIPDLDDVQESINHTLVPYWDPEAAKPDGKPSLRVRYDISNVEAFQENFGEKIKNAERLWRMGFSLKAINKKLELGFDEEEDIEREQVITQASRGRPKESKDSKVDYSEEEKTLFWKNFEDDRVVWENKVLGMVNDRFLEEVEDVVNAYEKGGEMGALAAVEGQRLEWLTLLDSVYSEVVPYFGQLEVDRIDDEINKGTKPGETKAFVFDVFSDAVRTFILTQAADKVTKMTETTKEEIKKAIDEGFDEDETSVEIARRIRTKYNHWAGEDDSDIDVYRSLLISRTEVGSSSRFANREGAVQAEEQLDLILEKEWLDSRDDRVRDSHKFMDGERKPLNQLYSNGLMFPGDPDGPADEVILCRCSEIHHVVGRS